MYGTVVPFDRSFLIVGGNNGNGQLNTIYKYLVYEEEWEELNTRLPRAAEKLTAMVIGWEQRLLFPTCQGQGQGQGQV